MSGYYKLSCLTLVWLAFPSFLPGQARPIFFDNPGFEDKPARSSPPKGWYTCGLAGYSPPDVQPIPDFGPQLAPFEGQSYVGMVVRDDYSWECLGQELPVPLMPGQAYVLQVQLAKPEAYRNFSISTGEPSNYTQPVSLLLWGAYRPGDREALLRQSPPIQDGNWRRYSLKFQVQEPFTHLMLEAYFINDEVEPYNGSLLMDDLSHIVPLDKQLALDTLSRPEKADWTTWAKQIQFSDRQELIKATFVAESDKRIYWANPGVYLSVEYCKSQSGQRLEWEIQALNRKTFNQRKQALSTQMEALGLPENRYRMIWVEAEQANAQTIVAIRTW